jgi:hypothetical protein
MLEAVDETLGGIELDEDGISVWTTKKRVKIFFAHA